MNTIKRLNRSGFLASVLLMVCFVMALLYACTKKHDVNVQTPVITSVNKTTLAVGDTLVISGSLFSSSPAVDQVAIASSTLKVIAASSTQLSAVIPAGTHTGQLTVALAEGQAASYPDSIVIVVTGQPFITSITPAMAYSGDTVVIRGGNFSTPVTNTGVSLSAAPATIVNITDTLIRVVIPDLAYTGPALVTCNGLTSLPFHFTVQKANPLADGRLYWVNTVLSESGSYNQVPLGAIFSRGKDSATITPFGTVAYTDNLAEFQAPNTYNFYHFGPLNMNSPIVKDAGGNIYYLAILNSMNADYSNTALYNLVKMTITPTGLTHTVIWSQAYNSYTVASDTVYTNPLDSTDYQIVVDNAPQPNIAMDGNKVYIKIGATDSFYTGDVSQPTPVFTEQPLNLVDNSLSQNLQFGKNYIFYQAIEPDMNYQLNNITVRYQQRGSSTSQAVPIDPSLTILATMADPSHGDDILILTTTGLPGYVSNPVGTIYKFDAPTQTLTKLYDQSNWADAVNFGPFQTTTGILWAGSHIYYANCSRNLIVNNGSPSYAYNGLYTLNDDGSSTKAYNVYPRLEPLSVTPASTYTYLFTGTN